MALNFLNNGYFAGKVGIGTETHLSTLTIKGGSEALRFERDSQETYRVLHGTSGLYFSHPNSGALLLGLTQNGDITVSNDQSAEYVRFDNSSSNVGIGTVSPSSKLHVSGGSTTIPTLSTSHPFTISNTANSGMSIISGTDNTGQVVFGDGSDADVGRLRYQHSDNSMRFWTNASEKMIITSAGNVGIGTTSPSSTLTIATPAPNFNDSQNAIRLEYVGGASPNDIGPGIVFAQKWWSTSLDTQATGGIYGVKNGGDGAYGGGLVFYTQPNSGADMNQHMIINSSGNVGIGTTGPTTKLHVSGSGTVLTLQGSGTDVNALFKTSLSDNYLEFFLTQTMLKAASFGIVRGLLISMK